MSGQRGSSAVGGSSPERVTVPGRDSAETTPGRCLLYAAFSDIVASPFDAQPAVAGNEFAVRDLGLPYELGNLDALLNEWRGCDVTQLKRDYSGLFEVGNDGPPVPIREDLHRNQPAGVREDIVRFYEYFGYSLEERFAWAPDHLSVELEFMHYLCYREVEASGGEGDTLSYQLGQHDFAERHLCNWVPELAEKIRRLRGDSLYGNLVAALSEFLVKDFEWQSSTISGADQGS